MAQNILNNENEREKGPQYTLENLYFTAFNECRKFDEEGNVYYVPIEKNTHPTGVHVFDNFLNYLSAGNNNVPAFCKREGFSVKAFSHFCEVLTGMKVTTLKMKWVERTVLDLLRYSNLTIKEVAERSGVGSHFNLNRVCKKLSGYSAWNYRFYTQEEGEAGKYRI